MSMGFGFLDDISQPPSAESAILQPDYEANLSKTCPKTKHRIAIDNEVPEERENSERTHIQMSDFS